MKGEEAEGESCERRSRSSERLDKENARSVYIYYERLP